jgi:hypothetical protein
MLIAAYSTAVGRVNEGDHEPCAQALHQIEAQGCVLIRRVQPVND